MTDDKRALKVFLCHAHSDKDTVKALYARLKREGVDVWLDKEKLLPGADWELEIRKAVREADVVVVCLSKQFNQAGFRQKEVRIALDAAMEKPEGEIFIIPARLEECDTLESLNRWHWVDLFESDGFQRLILALRIRAEKIGAALRQRGRTVSRPKVNAEQEAARAKAKLEAEEAEKNRLAQEQADREAAERLAREKAEQEAAEKAHLEAEEVEKQRLGKEQADRDTADALRDAAEKAHLDAKELEKRKAEERAAVKVSQPPKNKPNAIIIIAMIGLVGILCTALISSPLWQRLFLPMPEPTAVISTPAKTRMPAPSKTPLPSNTFTDTRTPAPTKTLLPSNTPTKAFTPTLLPTEIVDDKGAIMRVVPPGEFTMGSEDGNDDEKPVHIVYLDAFYMDKYEVTNALYKACVAASVCAQPQNTSRYDDRAYENHPVAYIDWYQAKTYCEWRGGSLPTEAQWEKAARGTDERTYPWGEGIDCNKVNYSGCRGGATSVGSYESGKSIYGIYDLAGNDWEWTADWYSETYSKTSPSKNPLGPDSGTYRVLRGGSWSSYDDYIRSASRNYGTPSMIDYDVGFRCARSLP